LVAVTRASGDCLGGETQFSGRPDRPGTLFFAVSLFTADRAWAKKISARRHSFAVRGRYDWKGPKLIVAAAHFLPSGLYP
jgi:hypothetical protein